MPGSDTSVSTTPSHEARTTMMPARISVPLPVLRATCSRLTNRARQVVRDPSHRIARRRPGRTETATRMAASRLRKRYRNLLREEIAHTVSRPEEIDEEVQHLFKALGR